MRILLNGEPHDLDPAATVLSLLESLSIDPRMVAVEVNRLVVKRERFADTRIPKDAEVEVVAFVGGGQR